MNDNIDPLIKIEDHPFFTGPLKMSDGYSYPEVLPFYFGIHPKYAIPRLIMTHEIRAALDKAYSTGSMASTPLGESPLAEVRMNEVMDKLLSLFDGNIEGKTMLEIGCGNGELLNQLKIRGAIVTGLEIGPQAKIVEERYGIRMLTEPLVVGSLQEKFDCIFSYGCLEHIENLQNFFEASRSHLNENGLFFHSVPNSALSFEKVHLYHLLHEHINYYTPENGVALLNAQGFCFANAAVTVSGNELMIWGFYKQNVELRWPTERIADETLLVNEYAEKLAVKTERTRAKIADFIANRVTIGFYAGGYEYGYAFKENNIRYFDGDDFKHGRKWLKFLPAIETPNSLVSNPVDKLIICKPHYFNAIKNALVKAGYSENNLLNIDLL